jgi:hypothetical protein
MAENTLENCRNSSSGKGEPRCATALIPKLNSTPATMPAETKPKLRNLRVPMHIPEFKVVNAET